MSTWADDVVARVEGALRPLADADRAVPMAAYMKHHFEFLGVMSPARRTAQRAALKAIAKPTEAQLGDAVLLLWQFDEREFQYAAIDLLGTFNKLCTPTFLTSVAQELIVTKSWWDSIDGLVSAIVEPLVQRNPSLVAVLRDWIDSDNRWLARSAILHQLHRKETTDVALLFEFCERRAHDREFFIAKAIGWALREYSYVDGPAVEKFVSAHTELQPLTRREALKALNRRGLQTP
jgi:3-methyladenine DNA glycosylase AlkD